MTKSHWIGLIAAMAYLTERLFFCDDCELVVEKALLSSGFFSVDTLWMGWVIILALPLLLFKRTCWLYLGILFLVMIAHWMGIK